MTKRTRYVLGPDVADDEVVRDSKGRVIDDDYVERAVDDAHRRMDQRGRPSLSTSGESPMLRVRLPRELAEAVDRAARNAQQSRSEWVRHALGETVRKAG